MAPLLEATHLDRSFSGFRAVNDVSIALRQGEFHSLIGPNGAGKTTLFNLISGVLRPQSGRINFHGGDITRMAPHRRCRAGIGRTFQINSLFLKMAVKESIKIPLLARAGLLNRPFRRATNMLEKETNDLLATIGLAEVAEKLSAELSYGDRRRLEFGIALASAPSLLLLDEPSSGLSIVERREFVELLQTVVRDRRITVLLIEHDMDLVFSVADIITVMHRGGVIAQGSPSEIAKSQAVRNVYLG